MNFNNIVDEALFFANSVLEVEVKGWDYAIVDYDTPKHLIEEIVMAYADKENAIIVNPFFEKILKVQLIKANLSLELMIPIIYSKVLHEVRHAWQFQHPESFNLDFNQTYGKIGLQYIKNPLETDSYALEEAFLKFVFDDENFKVNFGEKFTNVDKKYFDNLHQKADELYATYLKQFEKYGDILIDSFGENFKENIC